MNVGLSKRIAVGDDYAAHVTENTLGELRRAILEPWIPKPPYDLGSPAESWGVSGKLFDASCKGSPQSRPVEHDQAEREIIAAATLAGSLLDKVAGCMEIGYDVAAKRLAFLAAHLVMTLNHAARRNPGIHKAICEFSAPSIWFPVMIGRHNDLHGRTYIEGMLDFWKIASELERPQEGFEAMKPSTSGNPSGTLTVAQIWVERLSSQFHFHPLTLDLLVPKEMHPAWVAAGFAHGPLDRNQAMTAKEATDRFQWAWQALLWAADGKPETIDELAAAAKGIVPGPQKIEKADWPVERLQIEILLRNAWVARYVVKKPRGKGKSGGWVADLPPPPEKSAKLSTKPTATRAPRRGPKL